VGSEATAGFAFDLRRRTGEFGVLLFVYKCLEYFVSCRVQKYFVRDGLRFHLSALLRLNFRALQWSMTLAHAFVSVHLNVPSDQDGHPGPGLCSAALQGGICSALRMR
jgi:hypothetical protein